MRDAGVVEPVSRGVYRLAALEPLAHPDLVTVAKRVPQGVLCLISALSFHELTTQVPHVIDVALERGTRKPRLDYPPTCFFWFFLLAQMNNGAFRTKTPSTAFFVDVSEQLNTPTVIFAGKLIARVGLATNKPAEFIILRISQDTRALEAELAAAEG